jgi:hypothetical protein
MGLEAISITSVIPGFLISKTDRQTEREREREREREKRGTGMLCTHLWH